MSVALALLLAVGAAEPPPLILEAMREPAAVEVSLALAAPLPDALAEALVSGAEVRLTYLLRVKAKRKLWWDRRVWGGEVVTIAAFDPVTGRYRCEMILDGIITASREVELLADARRWLVEPAPVRVELPESRRQAVLEVRARAVFSSGTTWLVFPTQEATPWTNLILVPPGTADADDG
jgi:hypothetical protein